MVVKRLSDVVYRIQEGPRCWLKVVHHNWSKPHYGTPPEWHQKAAELQPKEADVDMTPVEEPASPIDDGLATAAATLQEHDVGSDSELPHDVPAEMEDSEPPCDAQAAPDETPVESTARHYMYHELTYLASHFVTTSDM